MEIIYLLGATVLGLLVGGYTNARVMRTRESLVFTTARACSICAQPSHPKEYLPIIGYFAVKGRCHKCSAVIPWQYPATEAVFAAVFLLLAARALGLWGLDLPDFVGSTEVLLLFVRDAVVASALILIFVFDFRAYVIPDRLSIPAMIVAIVCNLILGLSVPAILIGGFLIGGFFALQYLLSGGRWVGGGDVRMGMLMGFLLGPSIGITALLLSYVLGSIMGIYLVAAKKRALGSHVPFGTFMAVGTLIAMLWGEAIFEWYLGFFF